MNHLSGPDIRIVPIREEHIESFHRCLDSVARERRYLALLQAPPLEAAREFILSNISRNAPQLVALKGEGVVGWIDILPLKPEGFTHRGVLGMGVSRDYRGMGIGKRLLEHAIEKARESGLERVELEVFASNVPAIQLYEKNGFQIEGVKKKARKIDGRYDDVVLMAKGL